MEQIICKLVGVLGLIGIIIGILIRNEKKQDAFFIVGGLLLLVYSAYIKDIVFIVLQLVFVAVAAGELVKLSTRRSLWKRLRDKI